MSDIDNAIAEVSPFYKKKKDKGQDIPSEKFKLVYDSSTETLEPVYFWVLDFMNEMFGGDVEKVVDNFASSIFDFSKSNIGFNLKNRSNHLLVFEGIFSFVFQLSEKCQIILLSNQ